MFKTGDKILYPMHGAGVIEDIETKNVLGKESKYYILNLPTKNMKVMIPVDRGEMLKLRAVIDSSKVDDLFSKFNKDYVDQGLNWSRRYKNNLEKVKSGDIYELVDVIRELIQRDNLKGLSTGERKMLNDSKHLFVSEVTIASEYGKKEVESLIRSSIWKKV